MHVADLVTEASSYTRAWLPALRERGGELRWAINFVDRGQGGENILKQNSVEAFHLMQLGAPFFERLQRAGYFDEATQDMLCAYLREPRESMKRLLEEYPEILRNALRSPEARTRQRAEQLLAQNPYGFTPEALAILKRA